MPAGFEVDLTSLVRAAEGVNGVITAMRYSKVADIGGPDARYGNADLANVLADFCTRWEIGVEHLANNAEQIANRLTQSAETYAQVEQANVSMISGLLEQEPGIDPAAPLWSCSLAKPAIQPG